MDSKSIFAEYISKHSSLKHEEVELICSYFQQEFLTKESRLVVAGSKYKKIVFVAEGILRLFVIDHNGEEVVKNFIEPNCFFADIESIDKNQNSLINVSTVTDCTLLTLSKPDADDLVKVFPQWDYMMKSGALNAMSDMIRKQEFLHIGDSARQYHHFVTHFPLLAKQVPLKYIASYLRITQSSLSRIRRLME